MKMLTTPEEVLVECDVFLAKINETIMDSLGMPEDTRTGLQVPLASILIMFHKLAALKPSAEIMTIFLNGILFRSLALLSMFEPADFDGVLSNVLAGVGRQGWKQVDCQKLFTAPKQETNREAGN